MIIHDASSDYWSDHSTRPTKASLSSDIEDEFNRIFSPHSKTFAEESIRSHQARNRILRFLLMNALIWPIVVFVGLQFANSHPPIVSKSVSTASGAQAMNADQLVALVATQARPVFWLNRLSGDTYSENSTVSGVDVISYLPENSNPKFASHLDLEIKTYRDSNVFNLQLHSLSGAANTTVVNVGGVSVLYNPASPDHAVVTFKDRPQVVSINYPRFQNVSTLVMDAQNLAPIS